MRFFENTPQENIDQKYLDRTKEQAESRTELSRKEWNLFARELTDRLTDVPWQEQGSFSFELSGGEDGERSICFIEYDSSVDDNLSDHLGSFDRISHGTYDVDGGSTDFSKPEVGQYRRIKNFVISKPGKEDLSLKDFCDGNSVYVYLETFSKNITPIEKIKQSSGFAKLSKTGNENAMIEVKADLTTLGGISALFHELGHVHKKHGPSLARSSFGMGLDINIEDQAEIIREERDAFAFSLQALRDFLDHNTMQRLGELSQLSIKAYHDSFASCMNYYGHGKPGWFTNFLDNLLKKIGKQERTLKDGPDGIAEEL